VSLLIETNLKTILGKIPHNTIVTSKWLKENGVSRQLLMKYKNSNWLEKISNGAFVKLGDKYDLNGAIYALQSQLNLSIHVGGISALNNHYGIMQNVPFNRKTQLFGYRGEKLPKWFKLLYENDTELTCTTFLPEDLGLVKIKTGDFEIKVSSLERAVLEMIYLCPEKFTLNEAYQIMEMITVAKPKEFQKLLEASNSVKVNRLFLYMAEKVNHPWFKRLDISKIKLGKGIREITKGGKYNSKYNIIIGNIEEI